MKKLLIIAGIIAVVLLTACSGSPSFTGTPSYSQVLQTYPENAQLCSTNATVAQVSGTWRFQGNLDSLLGVQWYGTKVTASTNVTMYGKTYPAGTLITVDKDRHWIVVSSWD